jgi:F0F1-type ATP synthase assembly protein I
MGLGLLPLEKIPLFIWGLLLALIGGYLLLNDDFTMSTQWKNISMISIGLLASIYDIRKRFTTSQKGDVDGANRSDED